MKPLLIPVKSNPGNPASVTLDEALNALRNSRTKFQFLRDVDLEQLAEVIRELAEGLVFAAFEYREANPDMPITLDTVRAVLATPRRGAEHE